MVYFPHQSRANFVAEKFSQIFGEMKPVYNGDLFTYIRVIFAEIFSILQDIGILIQKQSYA